MKYLRSIGVVAFHLACIVARGEDPSLFPVAEFQAAKNLRSSFSAGAGKAVDNARIYDNKLAQSFVASQTARVVSVEAVVMPVLTSDPAPLMVSIHTLENGFPGKMIASAKIPFSEIPDGEELRMLTLSNSFTAKADFDERPLVWGGRSYCIVYSSADPPANYHLAGTRQNDAVYLYGRLFKSKRNGGFEVTEEGDLFFRITASPVNFVPIVVVLTLMVAFAAGCFIYWKSKKEMQQADAANRTQLGG